MSYQSWKLLFQRLILAIKKHFLSILRGVTFLLTQWDAYVNSILHCVFTWCDDNNYMVWWQQQTYAQQSPWSCWELVLWWSLAIRVLLSNGKDCQHSRHRDNNKAMLSLVVNKDCRQREPLNHKIAKTRIFSLFTTPPRLSIAGYFTFQDLLAAWSAPNSKKISK